MSSSLLTPGPTFPAPYGRYVLLDKIGEGGMAEVFRAAVLGPAGFQRILVIKRILSSISQDQSFVGMFIDEANLCARLSHPNIVQIYDFGKVADTYFIAMEYVLGCNVSAMISKVVKMHRLLPPPVAADISRQVCLGLDYAHTLKIGDRPLGIVHRDVSPTNIMVAYTGAVKILDFGIARAAEGRETSTRSGMLKGKIAYLAPEQIHFGPLDCRVDIFAAGIVLYEMLAGRRLFRANNDLQMMKMIMEMAIPPLAVMNPEVKPDLARVVMRALERDPNRRYSSAAEMASDLEGYLLDERHSAKTTSLFLGDLFGEEISRTPVSEISTDRLLDMMRTATPKGFSTRDPASDPNAPAGKASARAGAKPLSDSIVADDPTVIPGSEDLRPENLRSEDLRPEERVRDPLRTEGRICDPRVRDPRVRDPRVRDPRVRDLLQPEGRACGPRVRDSLRPEDSDSDPKIADPSTGPRVEEGHGPGNHSPEGHRPEGHRPEGHRPDLADPSEGSSQYLNMSITEGLRPQREYNASSLLRDERRLRNQRLGRIALAAGLAAASIAILLAAIHHADRYYEQSAVNAKTPVSQTFGSQTLRLQTLGSETLGSETLGSETLGAETLSKLSTPTPEPVHPRVADLQVRIWVNSNPQDAAIMRANRVVGTTPAAIYLPSGTEIVELIVVRTGYATASIKILPDLDKSVLVTLKPLLAKGPRTESLRPESLRPESLRPEGLRSARPKPAGSKSTRTMSSGRKVAHPAELPFPPHLGESIRRAIPVDPFGL